MDKKWYWIIAGVIAIAAGLTLWVENKKDRVEPERETTSVEADSAPLTEKKTRDSAVPPIQPPLRDDVRSPGMESPPPPNSAPPDAFPNYGTTPPPMIPPGSYGADSMPPVDSAPNLGSFDGMPPYDSNSPPPPPPMVDEDYMLPPPADFEGGDPDRMPPPPIDMPENPPPYEDFTPPPSADDL